MRFSRVLSWFLCIPHCAAAAEAQCPTPISATLEEHARAFEALFPKAKFDPQAFPYMLPAAVTGAGHYAGVTKAGAFTLVVSETFPIDLAALSAEPALKQAAALHGLQMTGVFARLATPAASTEVYGMVVTQTSVAGATKFVLGGLLSAVQAPGANPVAVSGACATTREGYPCSDFERGFDPWLCDSAEFDNYQASMVSACVAFQMAGIESERVFKARAAQCMNAFAKTLLESAAASWHAWLADNSPVRMPILNAAATLRTQLFGAQWSQAQALARAEATMRLTQASARRDFLDKVEMARKN